MRWHPCPWHPQPPNSPHQPEAVILCPALPASHLAMGCMHRTYNKLRWWHLTSHLCCNSVAAWHRPAIQSSMLTAETKNIMQMEALLHRCMLVMPRQTDVTKRLDSPGRMATAHVHTGAYARACPKCEQQNWAATIQDAKEQRLQMHMPMHWQGMRHAKEHHAEHNMLMIQGAAAKDNDWSRPVHQPQ